MSLQIAAVFVGFTGGVLVSYGYPSGSVSWPRYVVRAIGIFALVTAGYMLGVRS